MGETLNDNFVPSLFICRSSFSLLQPRQLSGTALSYRLDKRGFESRQGPGIFFLHYRVQTRSGAHAASYPMGTRGSFHEVKRSEREADHSIPYSA
jgi:hypothetical protein